MSPRAPSRLESGALFSGQPQGPGAWFEPRWHVMNKRGRAVCEPPSPEPPTPSSSSHVCPRLPPAATSGEEPCRALSGRPAGTLGGGGGAAGRPAWWVPGSLCREPSASYRGGAGGARVPRRGPAHQAVSRLSHEDLPSQAGEPHSWGKSPHLYRISWGPALAEGLILPNSLTTQHL